MKTESATIFGETFDSYLKDQASVLAVSTIREYKRTKRADLSEFDKMEIENITSELIKTTKSVAGNRYVPFPDFVMNRIRDRKGRIVHLKPNQISDHFSNLCNTKYHTK